MHCGTLEQDHAGTAARSFQCGAASGDTEADDEYVALLDPLRDGTTGRGENSSIEHVGKVGSTHGCRLGEN